MDEPTNQPSDDATPEGDDETLTPVAIPPAIEGFAELGEVDRAGLLDTLFADFGEGLADVELLEATVAEEVRGLNANRTAENVRRMGELIEYLDVIQAEKTRRSEAQGALDGNADGYMDRIAPIATGGEGDDGPADPAPPAGSDGVVVDNLTDPAAGEGGGDVAPAAEPVPVGATAAASATPIPRPKGAALSRKLSANRDSKAATATATIATPPAGGTGLSPTATDQLAVELLGVNGGEVAPLTALAAAKTSWASDITEGEELTIERLAEAVWGKRKALTNKRGSVRDDRIPLARASIAWPSERYLQADAMQNLGTFQVLQRSIETIVASGGSCAPAAPRYEINQYAVPMSPVEDNLGVLGAPRGSVSYVRALDFTQLRSGIGITTNEEDANPEGYGDESGQTDFKPCVHVDCPDIETKTVAAVSTCIEFGNLTFETWPEFVAVRLRDLAANFASVKEVFYLDRIDEDSTLSESTAVYGAYRALMRHVDFERWNYLKRHNMDVDAVLDWYAPDVVIPIVRQDLISDSSNGTQVVPTAADVTDRFQALGLNVVWYYDSATGEGQAFSEAIATEGGGANDANTPPTDIVWYLEAPGTHLRLDAGTLDLGIVRDSTLNRTNDLQIFAEQFIEVVMFGSQTIKGVTSGVCANGAAPALTTLHSCA